ncbi:MAG TPA: SDR family NAD(P)-dependent oxidoreductase [Woeseiaceae bacterium]|nr:SDR family NAD(P)-dependent oxidoreductase [Woeseiaceae bacterium]
MSFYRLVLLTLVLLSEFTIAADLRAADTPKAVLVTGASSGIGKAIAEDLASRGYFVYAGARKDADIAALSKVPNIEGIRLDVTIQQDIDDAVATISKAGRGLYGLVNNAGVGFVGEASKMREEDLISTMDVNVYGPFRITKAFAPLIIESKGRITTIGSISGILSSRRLAAYSMSKHAIEAYVDALATEMADYGVAVSVIEPGNYQSRIRDKVLEHARENGAGEKELAALQAWADTDYKEPDEVANAVYDALSSAHPKHRYMVVPNANEAEITIRKAMQEMLELNEDQPYSYDRNALVSMLDDMLAADTPD